MESFSFFFLCFGLTLFGIGEGLLLVSFTGASPWSVLAQGISLNVNLSIGIVTSMFTAIMCTRGIVNIVYGNKNIKELRI